MSDCRANWRIHRGQYAAPNSKAKSNIHGVYTARENHSGACLTDAAPEAAPGELFVGRRYAEDPNINLSGRCGSRRRWIIATSLQHETGTLNIGI
jgi:hypothetical protein